MTKPKNEDYEISSGNVFADLGLEQPEELNCSSISFTLRFRAIHILAEVRKYLVGLEKVRAPREKFALPWGEKKYNFARFVTNHS